MAFGKAVHKNFGKYLMGDPLDRGDCLEDGRRSSGAHRMQSVEVGYTLGTVWSWVAHGESDEVWEKLVQGIA